MSDGYSLFSGRTGSRTEHRLLLVLQYSPKTVKPHNRLLACWSTIAMPASLTEWNTRIKAFIGRRHRPATASATCVSTSLSLVSLSHRLLQTQHNLLLGFSRSLMSSLTRSASLWGWVLGCAFRCVCGGRSAQITGLGATHAVGAAGCLRMAW